MRETQPTPAIDYIRRLYAPEDALLTKIYAAAEAEGRPGMQVGAEEAALLAWLVKAHHVETIVEIGTFLGYSALWMARALPEGGMLHAIERDEAIAEKARGFFEASEVKDRLQLHVGDGEEVLHALQGEVQPDMVFIDANKSGYPAYLTWAEANLKPGGLLVADNTLLFGHVTQDEPPKGKRTMWAAMRSFNQALSDSDAFDSIMLPTVEGLTLAIKR